MRKRPFRAQFKLWLSSGETEGAFGDGKLRLLKATDAAGSLRGAAEALGISYRKAWGDIRKAEKWLGTELVRRERGGSERGGSWLTEDGKRWLAAWSLFRQDVEDAVDRSCRDRLGTLLESRLPEERSPFDAMLLLGAEGRNAGKTSFACAVISRFSRDFSVVGVKVTTVDGRKGPCPRGGAGCGACGSLEGPFCIVEERDRTPRKDTTRMLESGAARVYWARSRADSLRECLAALRGRVGPGELVVAESNRLARIVNPGLFLMLRERNAAAAKPSARGVLRHADRIVVSDGMSFDLDPADLAVRDGAWQLLDASAVILAGGSSSRMGMDKSFLEIRGVPLIERVIAQLRGRFCEILISADDPAPYRSTGLRVVLDEQPGQGPLMGIAAALQAARSDTVFVVACDIPDIDPRYLRRLLAAARRADCALPRRANGRWEPLFSAWRRSALPAIREVLAAGQRKIAAVFPMLRVTAVDLGEAAWLRNLNTPDDVAAYLASFGRDGPR